MLVVDLLHLFDASTEKTMEKITVSLLPSWNG